MGNHSFSMRLWSATILDRFFFCHKSYFSKNFWATHHETPKKLGQHETLKKLSQSYALGLRVLRSTVEDLFLSIFILFLIFCLSHTLSLFSVCLHLYPQFLCISIFILIVCLFLSFFYFSVCLYYFLHFLFVSHFSSFFVCLSLYPNFLYVPISIW